MENRDVEKAILETLEGIQKAPKMYGGPETLEVLVFVLLSLLEDPVRVREVFEDQAKQAVGHTTCMTLSSCLTEEQLVEVLKQIQEKVLKK
jgi:DNA gyrase/topoisomerase IV subunit B